MPFTVVFTVSSSVQSIPNAIRAKGQSRPLIALIAEQIEVTELESYSRPTYNKLCASSHDALAYRRCKCNQQARPSTSFVDHAIDLPWKNFLSPQFKWHRSGGKNPYFRIQAYPNFLITQWGYAERSLHAKNQLSAFKLLACDRQTDGHRQIDLGVDSEQYYHDEEQEGPQCRQWYLQQRFWIHNEHQPRTCNRNTFLSNVLYRVVAR